MRKAGEVGMIKVYCDRCGEELFWSGNVAQSNAIASINSMAQNINSDGYKTYDPGSGQMLDLCVKCKYLMQLHNSWTDAQRKGMK